MVEAENSRRRLPFDRLPTGQILDDPLGFVQARGLMSEADIAYPYQEDASGKAEVYDPFVEPYWRRVAAQRR